MINDTEVTEVKELVGIESPKAILMNSDDYGYGVFMNDERSSRFYEDHLDYISSELNRVVVIS
jgi:hypothetical protein